MDAQTYRNNVAPVLVEKYVTERRGVNIVRHQIESFNEFILKRIPSIIASCNTVDVNADYIPEMKIYRHKLSMCMENARLTRPTCLDKDGTTRMLTPQEARLRGINYTANLYVDIKISSKCIVSVDPMETSADEKTLRNVLIGKIPIMVKSKYCISQNLPLLSEGDCRYDYGGYFIVNGNEKVVISNDRMAENHTFVFVNSKMNTTYSHTAEIRSVAWNNDGAGTVKSLVLRVSSRQNQFGRYIRVAIPHAKQDVPVMLLFRVFGIETDRDVVDMIASCNVEEENELLRTHFWGSIAEGSEIRCARDALESLTKAMNYNYDTDEATASHLDYMRFVISRDILPHAGRNFQSKAMYLAHMVRRLLRCIAGLSEPDDRDSYVNKRVDTPGVMMASLFRVHYVRMIKEMRNSICREIMSGVWKPSGGFIQVINKVNISKHIKASIIDSGMKYALATGNWNVKGMTTLGNNKVVSRKQGVAQVLNRLTYMATLSHLRRINTPMEKNGKMVQPRKLHNTQWGIICPSECFDPGTPILMWNGMIKEANNVVAGDRLIDDAGNSVDVKSTCSGFKAMYNIVPDNENFMQYTVTDNHILTLKVQPFKDITSGMAQDEKVVSWFDKAALKYKYKYFKDEEELNAFYASLNDDNTIDITIEQFKSLPPHVQDNMYLFKSDGINWEHQEVALDPYILGLWLGDELSCGKTEGLGPLLDKYGLFEKKHIPYDYLVNDRDTRLSVLAGLIHATRRDASRQEMRKNDQLLHDAEFLANSLGFSCNMKDGSLNGPMQSSFKLIEKGIGPFVGWQLHGNGRFLLGDMSVSHNTPEGSSVGLVKNFALLASVTTHSEPWLVVHRLQYMGLQTSLSGTPVMVNGRIVGTHNNPVDLVSRLRHLKRNGIINVHTSIVLNIPERMVCINTEGGRFVRPLLVVDESHKQLKITTSDISDLRAGTKEMWHLIHEGKIEFVDVAESSNCMIAMTYEELIKGDRGSLRAFRYTHMEIDPACMMGITASCTPFSDHNQAPRNTYQCLDPNEMVLLADGSKKAIKDVEVGDSVVTFDTATKFTRVTNVVHQYVRETEHKIFEIETISGRKIVATGNHNFMTTEGWVAVEEFVPGETKVGILVYPEPVSPEVDEYTILDDASFADAMKKFNMTAKHIETLTAELTNLGILPLKSTDDRLPVLARMCGFIWADGSANVYHRDTYHKQWNKTYHRCLPQVAANFGSREDADLFERELVSLGFKGTQPCQRHRTLHGRIVHTWKISHSGAYAGLLIALGQRLGKRTEVPMQPVPDWVLNGSKLVKREFLAGFQGGDGCIIAIYTGDTPQCPMSYQSCSPEHTQYLVHFMDQMKGLLIDLGIQMRNTRVADGGYEKIKIGYELSESKSNLIDYFETVGYRYDYRKSIRSGVTVEYLKTQLLSEDRFTAAFDIWKNIVTTEGNGIFILVKSVTEVANRMISDITVADESHSFIAGAMFMVHNSAMIKQAIGVNVSNFNYRFDTVNHILHYPQSALVQTRAARLLRSDKLPNGVNAMVAIMTFTGYNQEDSVLLNRAALQRGMFTSTMYKTFREQNNRNHANGEEEFFSKPNPANTRNLKPCNYDKLQDNGFVQENGMIEDGDIIIGKSMPQKVGADLVYRDNSVAFKGADIAFVDRNCHQDNYFTTTNGDGYTFAKTRVRCVMEPVIGDKFSSRHAQKGTCGMILDEIELPFNADGLVPDLIMNTHAIPSRMTIAQLLEGVVAKAACVRGLYGNATAFQNGTFEQVASILTNEGMQGYGDEVMYDPVSGGQMQVDVFFTPTYYQRLKHLSGQKVHSRGANGPVVLLTRQPTEGRSREGALRLGSMETHVLVTHGVQQFLKERFMECSDNFRVFVCNKCGFLADANREQGMYVCRGCKHKSVDFSELRVPCSCKLLIQEIFSLGIGTRFITE